MTITGFEFQIREGDAHRWVRIMGPGGLRGDGMLAAANESGLRARAILALLKRAQRSLERYGHIRVLRSWELPPAERFEEIRPDFIRAVRPIRMNENPRAIDLEGDHSEMKVRS